MLLQDEMETSGHDGSGGEEIRQAVVLASTRENDEE